MLRRTGPLLVVALLAASLAAVVGGSSPAVSAGTYVERWCAIPLVTPCVQSFRINGVAQSSASPVGILVVDNGDLGGYQEVSFTLDPNGSDPAPGDVLELTLNTGAAFQPQRMLGVMGLTDVDRSTSGGNQLITITGTPVRWADNSSCYDFAGLPPWTCKAKADADSIRLSGDVAMLDDPRESTIGRYVGASAYYNGIFFEEQPDGTHAFTTDVGAPHYYADGTTEIVGDMRFRLSYREMRSEMGIPNPETLVAGSLGAVVRTPSGSASSGSVTTWHDPDGGGFFIRASGFTFSTKSIRVRAVRITPTRPTATGTRRATATRARVAHTLSKARGAAVTGYVARCSSTTGTHRVQATGPATSTRIAVTGLRRGKAYHCRVAARSKAGPSSWSNRVRIAARP